MRRRSAIPALAAGRERYPICVGRRHHDTMRPPSDAFRDGALATIDLYLGAYDTVDDRDVEVTDTSQVRL